MSVSQLVNVFRDRIEHAIPFFGIIGAVLFAYQLYCYVYNAYFHPLRKYPGPRLNAISSLPYVIGQLKGEVQQQIVDWHEEYGEVVRITPGELSFSSAEAWKDIYAFRKGGQPAPAKWDQFYKHPIAGTAPDIIGGDDATHARMRRIFSNAFSDRSLKMQENMFLTYVNRLIDLMRSTNEKDPDHKFDMVRLFNYTTFDIMGDLAFGEALNLLGEDTHHPWVEGMFANFKFGAYLHSMRYFPILEKALFKLLSLGPLAKLRAKHGEFTSSRVDKRLAKEDARPDIWGLVLARDEGTGLSKPEMYRNAELFMIAGTETTATLLSGLTYHLLNHPDKLQRLIDEIRTSFSDESEFTYERLQALPYLHACLEEGLRMYPPVNSGLPRITPPQGSVIDGRELPGGTVCFVHQLACYRNAKNFRDPYSFIPERWISDEYASDKKHALNPFSTGPRNCLGKNMAYHEMRIILAKVLYNFDLELCAEETGNFADTRNIFIMWMKGPLWCKLKPVQRLR